MEKQKTIFQLENLQLIQKLGEGSFGTVYKAIPLHNNTSYDHPCAVKVQTVEAIKPLLHVQYDIFTKLIEYQNSSHPRCFSIPRVFELKEQEYFSYIVMELLDITLEVILPKNQDFANKEMKNIFSKDCLLRIFYSLLKIIESIHRLGYLHRDIKPANFMLKKNANFNCKSPQHQKCSSTIYLDQARIYPIDLGLCKSYINPVTGQHISCKQNKKLVGTAIFCSLNTHKGIEQSRRDDIESLVYVMTYLVKKLPWEIISEKQNQANKEAFCPKENQKKVKYQEIQQIKNAINFNDFFNDPLLPKSYSQIHKKITETKFEEEPNYSQIYSLLQNEHYQLTNKKIDPNYFQCQWGDFTESVVKYKIDECKPKKSIKIDFKIPHHKLKKTNIKNSGQQYQTNQQHAQ